MSLDFDPKRTAHLCVDHEISMANCMRLAAHKVKFNQYSDQLNDFTDAAAPELGATVMIAQRPADGPVVYKNSVTAWYDADHLKVLPGKSQEAEKYAFDFLNPNFANYNVCIKNYASAFDGTQLDDFLDQNEIDTVIISGSWKSMCVWSTALDASRKYRTILATDMIYDEPEYVWRYPVKNEIAMKYRVNNSEMLDRDERFKRATSQQIMNVLNKPKK